MSEPADLPALLATSGSGEGGLTEEEAQDRLAREGRNEIVERRTPLLVRLLRHWWGPIPWMIETALVLSIVTGHWSDAAIIGALLVLNGAVSFWEEYQAGNAIEALQERLAADALVRRDGTWRTIDARDLVVGDVVRVHLGDVVPADLRLLAGSDLEVDQSALTGESLPVSRGRGEECYSGSVVTLGESDAVVVATGSRTYFGRTAQLVQEAGTVSHFQQAVLRIARYLIVLALVLVAVIVVVGVVRGNDLAELLEFALVVTVASIPVALPAVLSVTMAVGASQLAREDAVVSHLAAVEELGGVDVLCSDKTGTLTQNRLRTGEPAAVPGHDAAEVLGWAALASRRGTRDVIDRAVVTAADQVGLPTGWEVEQFSPFDPVHKRTEAVVRRGDGATARVTKGAPQVIWGLLDPDDRRTAAAMDFARGAVAEFAAAGSRALGVARAGAGDGDGDGDGDGGSWQLLGVIPLADPPRDDSRATIEAARALGVDVKMVTGDQGAIAREIAAEVGLGGRILDADRLVGDEEAAADVVEDADGFSQVFPEHKHRIVELLQQRGHLVGMTGDGVNDAPALKQADAGIAVAGATDAARAAADIVLLAPGLRVIVGAIRTSREIFERMTSYAIYRITETIRVLLFVTASIVVFDVFPVTTIMIVLLALLNDGAILSIAYDRATAAPTPVTWRMRTVLSVATALGLAGVVASFSLFAVANAVAHLPEDQLQTLMYLKLSVAGHLTIFLTRTRGPFWSSRPSNLLLGAVLGTQTLATLIAVYGVFVPAIGWGWAAVVWAYALVWFVVNDQVKQLTYRVVEGDGTASAAARRGASGVTAA
ncbi:MAG: plasma-membrane proton-efflux P-type ATPase [Acidimicrobiales bacterium]